MILRVGKNILSSSDIVKVVPSVLQKRLPKEIAVFELSASKSRALNRRYRKKDKAANVLSFWYSKEYGEIIVCPVVIRREARAQGHTYQYQMTWMILHGTIHLSGLHHEKSAAAAKKAEALEQKILGSLFNGQQDHHLP